MASPGIEPGTHPRQGYVLPLNYEADTNDVNPRHLKFSFIM